MDKKSLRNRAFSFKSSKKSHLFSFCFSLLTVMSSPCYRQRLKLAFLLLPLLCSCRAASDFSSDQETLGLWLGLAESGGCAEAIFVNTGDYEVHVWGIPSRLCTIETRSGRSYTEYLEIQRTEISLISAAASRYETAACADEVAAVRAYPADPLLLGPEGWGFIRDAGQYTTTRWYSIQNPVYEAQGFLKSDAGLTDHQIITARSASYAEYISIMAGLYVNQEATDTSDTICQTETLQLLKAYTPGWLVADQGDTSRGFYVLGMSFCYYGSDGVNPNARCVTLGPEFNG